MSSVRTVENPAGSPLDNLSDTTRKWPTSALADKVATESPAGVRIGSPAMERIVGPGANGTVKLSKPATKIINVQSFVTATGVASAKEYLTEGTDYSVNKKDATGVAALKELLGTDYSAATWVVSYLVDDAEGTIGGQSAAQRGSTNFPSQ